MFPGVEFPAFKLRRTPGRVVPGELDRRLIPAGGEVEPGDVPFAADFLLARAAFSFDARGIFEVERPEGNVHQMTADVPEHPFAERPVPPPVERMKPRVIRARRQRAEPEVVVEGWRRRVLGVVEGVMGAIVPDIDFGDGTNRAGLY